MYYLVKRSRKKQKIKNLILLGFIPILLFGLLFFKELDKGGITIYSVINGILVIAWIGGAIISNFALPPFEKIGELYFKDNSVKVLGNEIDLSDIELLKVVYVDIYGESNPPGSWAINYGDRNRFVLKTKSNGIYSHRILFEKKSQILYIQRALMYYYSQGVNVEFYRHNKLIFPKKDKQV